MTAVLILKPLDVGERPQRRNERAAYGYEGTREAAMAAFAKSWRRE
ncbi:MAG TPA: hypothetical protein VHI72_03940 [Hyphomicrobiaceae bacterium]|jgi:hypothetical protein|nr:hypothetical protein [Hyphomicrobiaceae bacterium]